MLAPCDCHAGVMPCHGHGLTACDERCELVESGPLVGRWAHACGDCEGFGFVEIEDDKQEEAA